jgi:hypothetical protein
MDTNFNSGSTFAALSAAKKQLQSMHRKANFYVLYTLHALTLKKDY